MITGCQCGGWLVWERVVTTLQSYFGSRVPGANEARVGSARRWPEVERDKVEVTRTSRPPLVVLGHTASLWPVKTLLWAEDLLTLCQQTENICTGTQHPHIFVS